MKKYLSTQERMARVFSVLFNVVMTLVLLIGSAAFPNNAHAASTITVNSTADNTTADGLCTLREAITNANNNAATFGDCIAGSGNDTIVFASSLGTTTITLSSALPTISDSAGLMIDGDNRVTLSGNDSVRVLYATGSLTLQNISVTHGKATTGGGGLLNDGSTMTITHSVFSNNSATGSGGGVENNSGTATILNSTFLNNSTTSDGGGIVNVAGTLTIANSTFSNNSAHYGGGVTNNSGTATILNSTFSGNFADTGGGVAAVWAATVTVPTTTIRNTILANSVAGGDCWIDVAHSAVLIGGNNIIESTSTCTSIATLTSDPNLGSLTGSPAYFPLGVGSPAIDAGDNAICAGAPVSNTSQNGLTRPQGAHCDIGSYEVPQSFGPISKWSSSFDLSHGWTVADFVRTVGDVNHDGNADLIGFGQDGVYVALSNGSSGFGPISKWSSSFDLSHGWTVKDFVRTVGDVNHDANADLIGFGSDGVYVALSNGSNGFGPISKWSSSFDLSHGWTVNDFVRTVGDVHYDGDADLIGFGSDGVYVARSNGSSSFDPISKWSSSFDLSHGWTVKDFVRTAGDVNHNNQADLIGFGQDGVYVALSNGSNGFGPISKWSSSFDLSHGWTVADFVRKVGDVNGDDMSDLVGFGQDGVYVALSNGSNGFGPISKWSSDFDLSHGWTVADFVRTVGDVNHDGKADLVGFGLDGVYVATAKQ